VSKRRHHYVPVVLCKRFTHDWRNFYRFDCANYGAGAIPISVKDAFVQKDLNTINLSGTKNTEFIEDFLDRFYERTFGRSINKIFKILFENAKNIIFEPDDYYNILDFCILSYLRTPKRLRDIHIQTLRRKYLFSIFAKTNNELPEVNNNYILTKTLFEGVNIIKKYIRGIKLRIAYHTFEDEHFLLVDQPVALVNNYDREFSSPDLDIVLPISRNVVLIFSKSANESDITHIKNRDTIENINLQLCASINKYIACANKEYLERFVEKHRIESTVLPKIEDIESERERIINDIQTELNRKPLGRYIRISKSGIEFLN
jgi:hypothetical protein